MVFPQIDYLFAEEKTSQSDSNSNSPLFGLIDLFLYFLYFTFFNKIQQIFSSFQFFLLCRLQSRSSEVSEFSHQEIQSDVNRESGEIIERDEVKMVMAKLRLFCSSETEELEEKYGSKEVFELFEDQDPSLEEVKQAFDVFDENKDGFIDARELLRVLCILGLKEASEFENCLKMISNSDENQDGRIDFIEFVKIMENRFS